MEIITNRIKIDKYSDGYVLTIKDKNKTIISEFKTPCFISYKYRLFELDIDILFEHKTDEIYRYNNEDFKRILPLVLEYGTLLPRE